MIYKVTFGGHAPVRVASTFPSVAARIVAESLGLKGDALCVVVDETDGSLTHWKISMLEVWYARPAMETDEFWRLRDSD